MLIVHMLADAPVNVDNEDLTQNKTRTLNSYRTLRTFLIATLRVTDSYFERMNSLKLTLALLTYSTVTKSQLLRTAAEYVGYWHKAL